MRDRHDHDSMMTRDRHRGEDRDRKAFFSSDEDVQRHSRDDDRYARTRGWGGLMDRDHERDRDRRPRGDSDMMSRRGREDDSRRGERDPEFGSDAYHKGVPMDETRSLIASNKVEGTPVYGRDGDRIGSIHNFMVDKRRGNVVYAVLKGSGGFLGMSQRYFPLEWDELTYDKRVDGYRIDMTEDELDSRRSFDISGREHRRDQDRGREREHSFDRSDRSRW